MSAVGHGIDNKVLTWGWLIYSTDRDFIIILGGDGQSVSFEAKGIRGFNIYCKTDRSVKDCLSLLTESLPEGPLVNSFFFVSYSYSSSSTYPGPGRGGNRLSRDAQMSLSPDTSSSSSGSPRHSQASRET
ncbi:hypothetical protein ILYODFUR_033974 [Ilyodon furcidens]|uniref:Uncharacterized protein n=1 Tax=Ilyodon furcidens TaxID=33524 RepID=A0ABV0UAQ1_9TELE